MKFIEIKIGDCFTYVQPATTPEWVKPFVFRKTADDAMQAVDGLDTGEIFDNLDVSKIDQEIEAIADQERE